MKKKQVHQHKTKMKESFGDRMVGVVCYIIFSLCALVCVYPFYYIFINTISANDLSARGVILFWPRGIHFQNYVSALKIDGLFQAAKISLGRTVIGTFCTVGASAFLGYMFTQEDMWHKKFWYRILVATMYFNAGIIPWFLTMKNMHLTNNFLGYILPAIVSPFNIILTKTFVESVPKELQEAAEIDGAGTIKVFLKIMIPVIKPIMATVAIFSAVNQWNAFQDTLLLMTDTKLYPLQFILYQYLNQASSLKALANSSASSGAMAAAFAVKKYLEDGHSGTVIFYGCPGEEGGAAKAFMARDRIWKELDAALTWHPSSVNQVTSGTCNTCIQVEYKFTGVASHASGAPELGRSALDAVELMNVGVQFLREHMPDSARIHYAITDAGGNSPNVVQPHAQVLYMVRSQLAKDALALEKRVDKIAEGAALMTETSVKKRFIDGCSNTVPNKVLETLLWKNFNEVGIPTYTKEEEEYAKAINKAIFPGTQGGPLMHIIAAKAVCFGEALKPEFKEYQKQVVNNAKALADALIAEGFNLVSGGTDNHLMLVDLQNMNITGKELQNRLDEVYITVNKNAVPNDPASPFVTSGVRIGTPAVTTRGLKEEDMKTIAKLIKMTITDFDTKADEIRAEVTKICDKYPLYE